MKIEIDEDDEENEEINTHSNDIDISNEFNLNYNNNENNISNLKINNNHNKNKEKNKNNFNSFSEQMEKKLHYYINQKDNRNLENFILNNLKNCFNYKINSMNLLQFSIFSFNPESAKTIMKIFSLKIEKKKFMSYLNYQDKNGLTAFHYSIIGNKNDSFFYDLISNKIDININTDLNYNAIHFSIIKKDKKIFLYLIENLKMNFNIIDNNGMNLIHFISFYKFNFGLVYLVKKLNINLKDKRKNKPIYYALINKSFDVIRILIENKCDLNDINFENDNIYNVINLVIRNKKKKKKIFDLIRYVNYNENIFLRIRNFFMFFFVEILIYFLILPNLYNLYFYYLNVELILFLFILFLCNLIVDSKIKNKNKFNYNINNENYINNNELNFCPICLIEENNKIKNNRHCFICNSCINEKMKHDAFFNKCIGKNNHIFYLLFHIFLILNLLEFIVFSFWNILKKNDDIINEKSSNIRIIIKKEFLYKKYLKIIYFIFITIVSFFYSGSIFNIKIKY